MERNQCESKKMPLEGIRVLDCCIWQLGPVAAALLGDMGAEVIKIEEPELGDPGRGLKMTRGVSTDIGYGKTWYVEHNNRNKKGITLDLKKPKGREALFRLLKNSDVFVHNLRLGVAERLGIHYEALAEANPKIIYASASGYGRRGPDSKEPAFDYLGLARSGMMNIAGEPDMPPLNYRGGIADQTGAIMLSYGILAALLMRERTGMGQEIHVSHLGSMITLMALDVFSTMALGFELPRQFRTEASNPLWNHYRCADGKWIALGMLQPDRQWPDVCRALGIESLIEDPGFQTMEQRAKNSKELIAVMDRIFITKTSNEWMSILKSAGDIICTPINTITDVIHDPQALQNNYIVDFDHPVLGKTRYPAIPVEFSRASTGVRLPAPELGQHTEEVLMHIGGYTTEEIERLRIDKVI